MEGWIERAWHVFPAGSNGEFDLPAELSIVIDRGEGPRLWDTTGREFLDFSLGWGSVLLGHARPEVVEAVAQRVARGSNFSYITSDSLALAEELVRACPACRQVRFCASGTEATMYCQRLARAFTSRPKLLRFEGAYHGANEVGVTSLFPNEPPDYPRPQPSSAGIARLVRDEVLVTPFNNLAMAEQVAEAHAGELAGIIVEPLQRCVPPEPGFLEGLRALATRLEALLIFDEVVTGFRLAYGGAQEYYGVVPDLVAYGKALGGGLPIGAFGGRREVIELVEERRLNRETYVWTASTLGGNPVSCAAANAALSVLRGEGTYERLHALGRALRAGMRQVLSEKQCDAAVIGDGPLAQVVLGGHDVRDYRSSRSPRSDDARRLMLELFRLGVFLNPMGTKLYLSLAHDEQIIDAFLDRFASALDCLGAIAG